MNLYTPVELPDDLPRFMHKSRLLLMGSCFATHIGQKLLDAKFRCDVNPYGVLYNPLSISTALREILAGREYGISDLQQYGGLWHSAMHHSDFSASAADEALWRINLRLRTAHELLPLADGLLLTWGTARVYEERETGRIVGNCHKRPERDFCRRCLTVEEVVADYTALLNLLLPMNPSLKLLLSVSPIRHVRDGMHANALSKAILLLAAEQLCDAFPGRVYYFPAYEIVTDELRDYRFYADDLVHPSALAVEYVWQRFREACIAPDALPVMDACESIRKSLAHKPFHPEGEEYKRFLGQIVLKMERLSEKYPYLDFQNERELCRTRLNK